MKQACAHTIEEIEQCTQYDECQRHFVVALKSPVSGDTSAYEIATGDGVRNVFLQHAGFVLIEQ